MIRQVKYGTSRVFKRFLVIAGNQNRVYGFDVSTYSGRSQRRMEAILKDTRSMMGSITREEAYEDLVSSFPGLKDCYRNLNVAENYYESFIAD